MSTKETVLITGASTGIGAVYADRTAISDLPGDVFGRHLQNLRRLRLC